MQASPYFLSRCSSFLLHYLQKWPQTVGFASDLACEGTMCTAWTGHQSGNALTLQPQSDFRHRVTLGGELSPFSRRGVISFAKENNNQKNHTDSRICIENP